MVTMTAEDWLSPLNKILIQRAVRVKANTVILRNGKKFKLDYDKRASENMVQIKPVEGFVPMGYFDLKKITHSSWLSESSG